MALTTRRRALTTLGAALAGSVALPAARALAGEKGHATRPLWRAHAHNDYAHPRPLFDALDHRFGSVEADIYLVGDQLLVAHDPVDLDPTRTLESLYLAPLAARVKANHGSVYRGYRRPLQLLIDIKTEGSSTYLKLDRHLSRYPHLFTTYAHGRVRTGPITAVISGDRAARTPMEAQSVRRAFYDGRLTDLGSAAPASFIPLISDNWTLNFTWLGDEPFRRRACEAARHHRGGAPTPPEGTVLGHPRPGGPGARGAVGPLLAADLDYFNTDDLAGLEAFLDAHE